MTYTIEQLTADIAEVVTYNWRDEERDYEECLSPDNENSPVGHIFLTLKRLAAFLGAER